jgi:hypothetical protein
MSRTCTSSSRVAVQPVGLLGLFRMNARAHQHPVEPVEVQREAAVRQRGQRQLVHHSATQARGVADIRPGRAVQHNAVSGTHSRRQRDRDRGHARCGDLDARLHDGTVVQLCQVVRQGGSQFRQAAHIGIARLAAAQRRHGRLVRSGRTGLV